MASPSLTTCIDLALVTLSKATPLWLACLGGLLSELSGVINFALEGMMLTGAFCAVWMTFWSGSPWVGLLAGASGGCAVGVLHAVATLKLRANQIVSSIALNLLAAGVTGTLLHQVFHVYGTSPSVTQLPGLVQVARWAGADVESELWKPLEAMSVLVPLTIFVGVIFIWAFRSAVWGLRIRACGENPSAAESSGLSVFRVRFLSVALGGALGGIGGACLSIGTLSQFVEQMTQGRGYLAIAAIILGRWIPARVLLATLLFGFCEALSEWLSVRWATWPPQFFLSMPYLVCFSFLLLQVSRKRPPSALGRV